MNFQQAIDRISFPVAKVPVFIQNNAGAYLKGVGCNIVRTDTNKAISQVSDTYGLIPHGDALTPILAALDGMGFDLKQTLVEGDGRRVMVKALSQKSWTVGNLKDGSSDDIRMTLLLSNSYDRTQSLKIMVGAFRLVCSNGMIIEHEAFKDLNIKVRVIHSQNQTKKLDLVAIGNQVAKLYMAMDKQVDTWMRMKNTEVKASALDSIKLKVLEPIIGERNLDKVVNLAYTGKGQDGRLTLWNLLNGMTEHYTSRVEKSKTPISATLNANRKNVQFMVALNNWAEENQDQLVTVNA